MHLGRRWSGKEKKRRGRKEEVEGDRVGGGGG